MKKKQRKTRKLLNNTAHIVPNTTINIKCIKNRVSWYFLQNCPFYVICWILQFAKENIAFAKMSIMLLIRIPELTVTANIDAQCFATTLSIFSQKYATRVLRTFLFLVESTSPSQYRTCTFSCLKKLFMITYTWPFMNLTDCCYSENY